MDFYANTIHIILLRLCIYYYIYEILYDMKKEMKYIIKNYV